MLSYRYSASRSHFRPRPMGANAPSGFLNPLNQRQAMTLYLRTGMRMGSALIAVVITLLGIMFVSLWFTTNI